MQSTAYSVSPTTMPFSVIAVDAQAVGVDQGHVVAVERRQVVVVVAGPLAADAVPGLERLGRGGVLDDVVDALAHLRPSAGSRAPAAPRPLPRSPGSFLTSTANISVQPSCTRSTSGLPPVVMRDEVRHALLVPARLRGHLGEPLRIGVALVARADRRRRALEHVELLRPPRRASARPGRRWRRCR